MARFEKKDIPFYKYHNRLLDYLHMQGIDAQENVLTSCPWHEDSTPSFQVTTKSDGCQVFNCFGCHRSGDIYHAVEYCTGEKDRKKQFDEIDRIFGNGGEIETTFTPASHEKKEPSFVVDEEARKKFIAWLESQPNASDNILGYFAQRAQIKSSGELFQYPHEILRKLVTFFWWYPGKKAAKEQLGLPALLAAGVPPTSKTKNLPDEQKDIAWYHAGIVAKSPEGYKLLFMQDLESKKINPTAGVPYFPIPFEIPEEKPVVLVEGEIDAIVCQASGIENVFSMGGTGGLSVPKIEKYIIPKNVPEIILLADNDKPPFVGQKAFGLMPYGEDDEAQPETVPEKLIRAGFKGKIKVTSLPPDCGFKDPDDAIRNGRLDLVKNAIEGAKDYVPVERKKNAKKQKAETEVDGKEEKPIHGTIYTEWDTIPLKFFKSLLKKFTYSGLNADDRLPFLAAAYKACKEDGAVSALRDFCNSDFTEEELKKNAEQEFTPFHILDLAAKYDVSKFIIQKLEEALVPAKEILRIFKFEETIVPINYDKMIENPNLLAFLEKHDNFFAAATIADATEGNVIYVEKEKNHYAYTGVAWERLPGLAVEAHTMLQNILVKYLEKNLDKKDIINKLLKQIGSRRFRLDLVKDFDEFRGETYREDVMFDSSPVQATLTLQDGVLDFSGDKIKYRQANREEYRRQILPYTLSQIKKAGIPEQFLKLVEADFEPATPETLARNSTTTVQTLMYYLSLIQSRNTQYKYGGFFLGHGGTGKSTLCSIIDAVYPENCTQLQNEILISVGKRLQSANGPTPEIAKLEGKLIAFVQETPKDGRLNTNTFKLLTGGDKLSARFLNRDPHEFFPTAQILVSSNNSPDFEHGDDAAIKRMIIFRFNVEHEKGLKESKTPKEFIDSLRPEFPAIIKYLAERYIELHTIYKGKIPMSAECINEKNLYIQEQEKDTDRFVKLCIRFAFTDDNAFTSSKDLYACYLSLLGLEEGSKEAATQRQFTTWLKSDYKEFRRSYKQRRLGETGSPEWGFEHIALTDYGLELLNKAPQQQPNGQLDFGSNSTTHVSSPSSSQPDDDPFATSAPINTAPPPPPPPTTGDDEDEGEQFDIY